MTFKAARYRDGPLSNMPLYQMKLGGITFYECSVCRKKVLDL